MRRDEHLALEAEWRAWLEATRPVEAANPSTDES
jgi:hypothetical protein